MSAADAVGSIGVAILLGAFAANASGRLVPFVVLEGIWTLVAIGGLLWRPRPPHIAGTV